MRRHVSLRSFAVQTGFSPSFISQMENGQVSPSLGSLQKIADALGVTLGEFFASTTAGDESLTVRPPDRKRLDSTWTDAHLEALGSMSPGSKLEPVLAIFGPGGQSGKHAHSHSHEEFAYVVKGRATLTLGDEQAISPRVTRSRSPRTRRADGRTAAPRPSRSSWFPRGRGARRPASPPRRAAPPRPPGRRPLPRATTRRAPAVADGPHLLALDRVQDRRHDRAGRARAGGPGRPHAALPETHPDLAGDTTVTNSTLVRWGKNG